MNNLRKQLRTYVAEIEEIEAEIAKLNGDKSELYKSAKDADLDVAALRRVVAYRRKRAKGQPVDEAEERFAEYLGLVEDAEPRVHAHAHEGHDPDTGEIIDTPPPATSPSAHDGTEGKHASERKAQKANDAAPTASVGGAGEKPGAQEPHSEEAVNSPPPEMPDIPPSLDRRPEIARRTSKASQ